MIPLTIYGIFSVPGDTENIYSYYLAICIYYSFFILYYCDNFACKDCTQGDLNKYTYCIQIHNHGLLIR